MTRALDLRSENADRWGVALTLLDVQAPRIAEAADTLVEIKVRSGRKKLRARSPRFGIVVYWHDEIGVWVRYSCGFSRQGKQPKSVRRAGLPMYVSGLGITTGIAGENLRAGDLVQVGADGRYYRSIAANAIGHVL